MCLHFLVGAFCLSFGSYSLANSYSLGSIGCKDFKSSEAAFKREPENEYRRFAYAQCLIAKGEASSGLRHLHHLVETKYHVWSAYTIARYIETNGQFAPATVLGTDIIEAIKAYSRVLYFIDLDTDYPKGYEFMERNYQIELYSNSTLPRAYLDKYLKGLIGDYRRYKQVSPSYNEHRDLSTYPEYNPYTLDSLNQTIQKADNCLNMPRKRHFRPDLYTNVKRACQVHKEGAQALIPLEQQRQRLLTQEFCKKDILKCGEFFQLTKEIRSIYDETQNKAHQLVISVQF